MGRSLALALALWASGCGGAPGTGCAVDGDCADGLACVGPNDGPGCGIPPNQGCARDADCPTGLTCNAIDDACSPYGIGSECRSPCDSPYGGCADGFACVLGACQAVRCDEGWACPSNQACDPASIPAEPVYAQHHGCVAIACADDGPCGDGACVGGRCQDGPGHCAEVYAVP